MQVSDQHYPGCEDVFPFEAGYIGPPDMFRKFPCRRAVEESNTYCAILKEPGADDGTPDFPGAHPVTLDTSNQAPGSVVRSKGQV